VMTTKSDIYSFALSVMFVYRKGHVVISLWNLLQYHSIVRWAIQTQWAEPLV
jgi:hypothetical protein